MNTSIVSHFVSSHTIKAIGDITSTSIVFGTLLNLIPPLAGVISIVWVGFQFYHHPAVKEWRLRRKEQHGRDS